MATNNNQSAAGKGGRPRRGGSRGPRRERPEYDQKMLNLARVTRVVKGGRRFRFRATLVIGNRKGKVGVGVAKGSDVSDAIQKAFQAAKKNMITVQLTGSSIAHDVTAKYGSAKVLLKPAAAGRGLIAGGAVRAVMDLLGAKDIIAKSLGSSNNLNVAQATLLALARLRTRPEEAVVAEGASEKVAETKVADSKAEVTA